MTLRQLKYLIGIVDSGLNITAAAERLYTSQPGISKQLRGLRLHLAETGNGIVHIATVLISRKSGFFQELFGYEHRDAQP